MKLNESLWANHQYEALVSFIHHLAYWQCSHKLYEQSGIHSEFWIRTIDAHLLRAVVDWCMIFGADSNDIHWKKVVADESDQENFRRRLWNDLSITKAEFVAYWSSMTTFRNDFAAHRPAKSPHPCVPKMETALRVVTTYDQWLRDSMHAGFYFVLNQPILMDRYERLMRTSEEPLGKMILLGPTVDQEYEGRPPHR
jgi:hypothetical protein